MTKPKLTYFDLSASRGEECRIALHLAGVDFEDVRIKGSDWPAFKPTTPFGSMPTLELPGKPPLAQSVAILAYIGREHGLHPTDSFEAARHEALLAFAEDVRLTVSPTSRIKDEAEKKAAREAMATGFLPTWAGFVEKQLGAGPFVGGDKINVVDLKLYMVYRWFASGSVDHIPKTVFEPFARLTRLYRAVAEHPGVKAWLDRPTA